MTLTIQILRLNRHQHRLKQYNTTNDCNYLYENKLNNQREQMIVSYLDVNYSVSDDLFSKLNSCSNSATRSCDMPNDFA